LGLETALSTKEIIHRQLLGRGLTIAVAESVTAGLLQSKIAETPGSSAYFLGGVTAYTLDQKVQHLGVDQKHAEAHNCVSRQVAEDMAFGVTLMFGADVGVATTGYAEPDLGRGTLEPMAFYAILVEGHLLQSGELQAPGMDRNPAREFIANFVMDKLATCLLRPA